MRLPLIPILTVLVLGALVDFYLYRQLRNRHVPRGWCVIYAITSALFAALLIVLMCLPKRSTDDEGLRGIMWLLYTYFSVYIPKYVVSLWLLVGSLVRLIFKRRNYSRYRRDTNKKGRRIYAWTGCTLGICIFGAMWWGALFNRFHIDVREVDVEIPGLPAAFDGFTIAQISDFHVGTYGTDTTFVAKVVERINSLHPDAVVFTGDIVNRHSDELRPHIKPLSHTRARLGVYSVMGNHDYGDYYSWPSEEAHKADADSLKAMQGRIGWKMLNNSTQWFVQNGDSLALIGVENIGDPPFPVYGDIKKAYPTPGDRYTKILLSHNPAHWDTSIANNDDVNIALTLSGHTHAMQIEVMGLSPAVWRYPTWGGLYADDNGQQLYVNIGLGEVAIPARIGATPEITLITLRPAK